MIPASGSHAGHQVERGRCLDCDRWLTRADHLSVRCPLCGAVPEAGCTDEDGPRDRVHAERMWASQGHDPSEFAGLRARQLERTRESRGRRHRPAVLRESTPPGT
jgi:phage FluMu protein Com